MYKAVYVATDKGVHIFVRGYYAKLLKNNVSLIAHLSHQHPIRP